MVWRSLLLALKRRGAALSVAGLLVLSGSRAAAQTVPPPDVIRAGYSETLSLIQTLYCRYQVRLERHEKALAKSLKFYEVEYQTDGRRSATKLTSGYSPDQITNRVWNGFDGTTYAFWTEHSLVESGKPYYAPSGHVSREQRQSFGLVPATLDLFTGRTFWGSEGRLLDLFEKNLSPVVSREVLDGVETLSVDFGEHTGRLTTPEKPVVYRTRVWFDPAAGYLPRRLHAEYQFNEQFSSFECRVESFRMIKDAVSGRDIPLPEQAVYLRQPGDYRLTLLQAVVNQPLDTGKFKPEFPDGTRVTDNTKPGIVRRTIIGSLEKRKKMEELASASVVDFPTTPEDALVKRAGLSAPARTQTGTIMSRLPWLLSAAGLILASAAGWQFRRRRTE